MSKWYRGTAASFVAAITSVGVAWQGDPGRFAREMPTGYL
jgi:hypothetical protein